MADRPDSLPVDPQLSGEAIRLRDQFAQLVDGGANPGDPGLVDLQLDNLARAIGEGIPLASYALGMAAITRVLGRKVE